MKSAREGGRSQRVSVSPGADLWARMGRDFGAGLPSVRVWMVCGAAAVALWAAPVHGHQGDRMGGGGGTDRGAAGDAGLHVLDQPFDLTQENDPLATELRRRVEAGNASGRVTAAGAQLHSLETLTRFYEERRFEPAWVGRGGVKEEAFELVELLSSGSVDGLPTAGYHREVLDSLLTEADRDGTTGRSGEDPPAELLVDVELISTDAFLVLASHLHHGRSGPESVRPEWRAARGERDLAQVLEGVWGMGVEESLDALRPVDEGYRALSTARERLAEVSDEGGWDSIPSGPTLELGSEGERVELLWHRLRASGDLPDASSRFARMDRFGPAMHTAVLRFQARHGLEVDGRVGPQTLRALNVPVEARIRQVDVNLERWRWLPQDLGEDHILVNIADFTVDVIEGGERVKRIRSIVGRAYRQTPVFSDVMTYLVLAPYWHVPPGIAVNDQLPRIRNDPAGYLASQNMVLLEQGTHRQVDPVGVDWESLAASDFNRRFRIRQEPGPTNALGQVKFMFPNRYNVYLHDTPARELFDRPTRDFSSGCVRVQGALELAEYLLRDDPRWDRQAIRTAATGTVERTVWLPEPLPVHLQYWTAWVDEDGVLQFRNDIYSRDARVARALGADAPGF